MVGEELGVLPGMDSMFSALALERLVGFLGDMPQRNHQTDKFDIIIYDGISTEETIRMMGATSKARLVNSFSLPPSLALSLKSCMESYVLEQIIFEVSAQPS